MLRIHLRPSGAQKFMKHHSASQIALDWTRLAEYLAPSEYRRLLPRYAWRGHSDLDLFREFLTRSFPAKRSNKLGALELGPGTGRATEVFLGTLPSAGLTGVDLSRRMISFLSRRFPQSSASAWIQSDSLDYLRSGDSTFDLVYSLWSFSHAVHRRLALNGLIAGRKEVESVMRHFLENRLKPGGKFYLIHFDSCSDEQTISLRQRRRALPFLAVGKPSPSQVIVEKALDEAAARGIVRVDKQHFSGDEIALGNVAFAREVFLKFHMEDIFGHQSRGDPVYDELTSDLIDHQMEGGLVVVKPGWFEYIVEKF